MKTLKANNLHENVFKSLNSMLSSGCCTDVILVAENSVQVKVHKFMLAAASSYFREIFDFSVSWQNQQPVIVVFSHISSDILESIVNFIYKGVAEVEEEKLTRFLEAAFQLRLDTMVNSENSIQSKLVTEISSSSNRHEPEQVNLLDEAISSSSFVQSGDSSNFIPESEAEDKQFSAEPSFKAISTESTAESDFICHSCGKCFKSLLRLRDHFYCIHKHEEPTSKSIKCDVPGCFKTFKSKSLLSKHAKKVHSVPKHECSDCLKKFHTSYDLRRHADTVHSNGSKFLCERCMKSFSRKDNLKAHIRNSHSDLI